MRCLAGLVCVFALGFVGCGETTGTGGTSGGAGSGGTAGMGGTTPPPPAVDQSCRDWCANEPEGFSCHQGPPESVQGCYDDCLSDYQYEVARQCGDEWIAIKDCEVDLDCEDLFGDCDLAEDEYEECVRIAGNRQYCEMNCPELDINLCEQDTTLCQQRLDAKSYCAEYCPTQELEQCIAQRIDTGTCDYRDPTYNCRAYCSRQSLSLCVDQWIATGACEFDDGMAACHVLCPEFSNESYCWQYWEDNGVCPDSIPPPPCDAPGCIFCPAEALGPQGEIIGDLLTPVDFTATPQDPVVQGETATILIKGSSSISVPVPVSATITGDNTTYAATSGGEGTLELEIPEQNLMGTELNLNAGEGSGEFNVAADATELVIELASALIEIQVTEPAALELRLDASDSGDCSILGEGVSIEVGGAGGSGGAGGVGSLGACDNPADLMALANLGDPSEARRASATCGTTECSGVVDETTCVSRATICVGNRIPGLSLECSTCYGELAWCAGACNISCASNPCEGCLTCGQGSYAQCLEDLSACAGPLPPECSET